MRDPMRQKIIKYLSTKHKKAKRMNENDANLEALFLFFITSSSSFLEKFNKIKKKTKTLTTNFHSLID